MPSLTIQVHNAWWYSLVQIKEKEYLFPNDDGMHLFSTKMQLVYVIVQLLIGLMCFATVMGYIASIVTNISAARKDFQGEHWLTEWLTDSLTESLTE